MPRKRCGLGFDCGAMMMAPGLDPGECPNYKVCGHATELTPEEAFELVRVREIEEQERHERSQQIYETIRVTRHQAAVMMLMARGNPQTPDSLGLSELADLIASDVDQIGSLLERARNCYVAPEGVEAHQYNVKRPGGTYWYNKLTAETAIFEPAERTEKVRVLHLSHDDDPRNLEGRLGVERRIRLTQARTQMRVIAQALTETLMLLELVPCSSFDGNDVARTEVSSGEVAVSQTEQASQAELELLRSEVARLRQQQAQLGNLASLKQQVLVSLKLGRQAARYKLVAKALDYFIRQLQPLTTQETNK